MIDRIDLSGIDPAPATLSETLSTSADEGMLLESQAESQRVQSSGLSGGKVTVNEV